MNGVHLKLEDLIMPAIMRYEASIGVTVTDDDLPHDYAESHNDLPVLVQLTEIARNNQERHYSVRVELNINGQLETRKYDIIHNTASGVFNSKRIS